MKKLLLLTFILVVSLLTSCFSYRTPRTKPVLVYNVKPGDTLVQIAAHYEVPVSELQILNDITSPRTLQPGQRIRMPEELLHKPSRESKVNEKVVTALTKGSVRAEDDLLWPIREGKGITSDFGKRRFSFHEGIDIGGDRGTPIYAAHDGIVTLSGNKMRGYGNMVVIKSGKFLTVYAHNRQNLVRKGDRVVRGQKIATLGKTGRATGPHLHFETRVKNTKGKYVAVNPLLFFNKEYSVSAWNPKVFLHPLG